MNVRLLVLPMLLTPLMALPLASIRAEEGPPLEPALVVEEQDGAAELQMDLAEEQDSADQPEVDVAEYRIADDYWEPTWLDRLLGRSLVTQCLQAGGEEESEEGLPAAELSAPCYHHRASCIDWHMKGGDWYLTGEAVFFTRNNGEQVILGSSVSFENNPGGVIDDVLSTQDEGNTWSAGPRITLGYHYGDTDWEISYLGLQHWAAGRTIFGDPVGGLVLITSPFLTIDNVAVGLDTSLSYGYSSEYHTAEATIRREWDHGIWRIRLLGGLRYCCLDENFELIGINGFPTTTQETLTVDTRNDLLGGQFGGGLFWSRGRGLSLELLGKAGLYANFAQQETERRVRAGGVETINLAGSDSDTNLACGFDTGFNLRYAVSRCVTLRLGYELTLLSGLALAPEQLNTNLLSSTRVPGLPPRVPNNLDTNGTAVFHGPTVGLEIYWGGR